MSKNTVDIDYAEKSVPQSERRSLTTMFMIMLGFTFFSASMWVGQELADGLDFSGFVISLILGGVILGEAYNTDIDDVVSCVKRAGERSEALVLTSYGIHPNAKDIHMKTEWLERILSAAQKYGVAVLSFDEVPLRPGNKGVERVRAY